MSKQYAALWTFVLLVSLGLILFVIYAPKQSQTPPASAVPVMTASPAALVFAPTRFLPTIAPPGTVTPYIPPTPLPTITPFMATEAPAEPRVFLAPDSQLSQAMLINFCTGFGSPVSVRIFDWSNGGTISLSDQAIAQIPLGWDASKSIWLGYDSARSFDQPADARQRWKINLFLADGTERWIEIFTSPQTPDTNYVYSYQNTTPYSDSHGEHFGDHPCRAFSITARQMLDFLAVVNQYQDVVRYPALIAGGDPRWQRGIASPTAAIADLRSIPTTRYNDPIGSITKAISLWYALDPTWGGWAQVKLGSVQGWVDTGLVKFTSGG